MWVTLAEDRAALSQGIETAINNLVIGLPKSEQTVAVGDPVTALKVTGYWVEDVMRIDISIPKAKSDARQN